MSTACTWVPSPEHEYEQLGYLSTHQWEIYPGTGRMDEASHAMEPDIEKMIKSICAWHGFV